MNELKTAARHQRICRLLQHLPHGSDGSRPLLTYSLSSIVLRFCCSM